MVFPEMFHTSNGIDESSSSTSLTTRATHMWTEEFVFLRPVNQSEVSGEIGEPKQGRTIRTPVLAAPEQQGPYFIRHEHGTEDSS